jgi:hypothetical protein
MVDMKSLAPLIIIILVAAPFTASAFAHENCRSPYTKLWVYTFPPKSICVILSHPTGKDLAKQNQANIEYNAHQEYLAGKAAGERNSQRIGFNGWSCPSGNSKAFCLGWNETSCSSAGCAGDFTCDQWNDTKGCP